MCDCAKNNFLEQLYGSNSYSKCLHMLTRGKGVKNWSYDMYVLNGWSQTNIGEYFLCIGPAKYTKALPAARKMSLFSSIIIAIILSYAVVRIYTILHMYLQVSETEGQAELHGVIGQSVLEKTIQYTSRVYHLRFQECSFKNPNVLLKIQTFLISRLHK